MSKLLNVSSSPHVRDQVTTSNIMLDVAIAMIPATAYGVHQFGIKAALVILVTVLSWCSANTCTRHSWENQSRSATEAPW